MNLAIPPPTLPPSCSQENIKVCIRMRPLLPPYEDEVVWEVNQKGQSIFTQR